jgi:hypothetical protein
MGWNTPEFINGFLRGTLGRKKVHAGWRVIDGPHCSILCKATTRCGSPDGSEIYAMALKAKGQRLVFLHARNTYGHSYKIRRDLNTSQYQKLPEGYLRDSDTAIRDSGIIDLTQRHALIEFGDKPVLLCRAYTDKREPATTDAGLLKWGSLEPLDKRVASIPEALELAKDPEGCEVIAWEWYARPVLNPGDVPDFDPELSKTLATGVNPIDYGYEVEELQVTDARDNLCLLAVRGSILAVAADKRSVSYLAAVEAYHEASERFKKYQPEEHACLTIKAERYSSGSSSKSVTGRIVCTTQGVFIKGLIKSSENWVSETQCDQWYKLEKKMRRKSMS